LKEKPEDWTVQHTQQVAVLQQLMEYPVLKLNFDLLYKPLQDTWRGFSLIFFCGIIYT